MKKTATYQLMTNVLLWLAVLIVTIVFDAVKGVSINQPFPVVAIAKSIDVWLVASVLIAGFVVFGLFSIVGKRSKKPDDQRRANEYSELALDEIASALYNFGSLLLVCVFGGVTAWYLIGTILCYGIGYYLKPHDIDANDSVPGRAQVLQSATSASIN